MNLDFGVKKNISVFTTITENIQYLFCKTVRASASRCRKIQPTKSMSGNITQLKTRRLFKVIYFRTSWDSRRLYKECISEHHGIQKLIWVNFQKLFQKHLFWRNDLKTFNLKKLLNHTNLQTIGVSDVSGTSYTASLTINNVQYTVYNNLLDEENEKVVLGVEF